MVAIQWAMPLSHVFPEPAITILPLQVPNSMIFIWQQGRIDLKTLCCCAYSALHLHLQCMQISVQAFIMHSTSQAAVAMVA